MYVLSAAQVKSFDCADLHEPLMIADNCKKCYHWFLFSFSFLMTKPAVKTAGFVVDGRNCRLLQFVGAGILIATQLLLAMGTLEVTV